MQYVSTRGSAPALDFEGATLAGLASDGGLYVPAEWPRFTADEIAAMRGLPYAELAYGNPGENQSLLNVTNGKLVRLLVDDEPLDVRHGTLTHHERTLEWPERVVDAAS